MRLFSSSISTMLPPIIILLLWSTLLPFQGVVAQPNGNNIASSSSVVGSGSNSGSGGIGSILGGGFQVSPDGKYCLLGARRFEIGESLVDTFQTRCGSSEEYPCYCNPLLSPPIECPYCGFATSDGGLRCAKHEETITFIDLNNSGQSCSCQVPSTMSSTEEPIATCVEDELASICEVYVENNNNIMISSTNNNETNDSSNNWIRHEYGEELAIASRCESNINYPCYCNPNLPGKRYCPFCSIPKEDGSLLCISDGITTEISNDDTCSCEVPSSAYDDPIRSCSNDDNETPTVIGNDTMCILYDPVSGDELLFAHEESFGTAYTSPCETNVTGTDNSTMGEQQLWPCYCNLHATNYIFCPYCISENLDGTVTCAPMNDEIIVNTYDFVEEVVPGGPDGNESTVMGITVTEETCQCRATHNNNIMSRSSGSISSSSTAVIDCDSGISSMGCTTTLEDGTKVITSHRDFFEPGLIIEDGLCGSVNDYPWRCNINIDDDDDDTFAELEQAGLEYPYCIFDTFSSGIMCARNGEIIEITDIDGIDQVCSCLYLNVALGATSNCKPVTMAPTMSPNEVVPGDDNKSSATTSSISRITMMMLSQSLVVVTVMVVYFLS